MDKDTDTVVVQGIPIDEEQEQVIKRFTSVGNIKHDPYTGERMADIRIGKDYMGNPTREAMLTYASPQSAKDAVQTLKGEGMSVQPAARYFEQAFRVRKPGNEQRELDHFPVNSAGYHWFNWVRSTTSGVGGRGGKGGGLGAQDGQDGEGSGFVFIDQRKEKKRSQGGLGSWGGGGGGGGGIGGRGGDGGNGGCIIV